MSEIVRGFKAVYLPVLGQPVLLIVLRDDEDQNAFTGEIFLLRHIMPEKRVALHFATFRISKESLSAIEQAEPSVGNAEKHSSRSLLKRAFDEAMVGARGMMLSVQAQVFNRQPATTRDIKLLREQTLRRIKWRKALIQLRIRGMTERTIRKLLQVTKNTELAETLKILPKFHATVISDAESPEDSDPTQP